MDYQESHHFQKACLFNYKEKNTNNPTMETFEEVKMETQLFIIENKIFWTQN